MKAKPFITKIIYHKYIHTGKDYYTVYYKNKNPRKRDRVRFYTQATKPILSFISSSKDITEHDAGEQILIYYGRK